jgi:putative transposase
MSDRFTNAFTFFDPAQAVEITHRNLPHWEQAGTTYFITFRTADSLPAPVLTQWKSDRELWLHAHGIDGEDKSWRDQLAALSDNKQNEFRKRFNASWHEMLDAGHGECLLRRPHLANITAEAFHHFDGKRYALGEFVIMPNHVHLLAWFPPDCEGMKAQCKAWKRYTAVQINRALHRQGHFWQGESYDHLVRSTAQMEHYQTYIAENPTKARLRDGEYLYYRSPRADAEGK